MVVETLLVGHRFQAEKHGAVLPLKRDCIRTDRDTIVKQSGLEVHVFAPVNIEQVFYQSSG